MVKKDHPRCDHLKCTVCTTEIEVPLCCEEGMTVRDGKLVCFLCGSNKEIPICCGKEMKLAKSD